MRAFSSAEAYFSRGPLLFPSIISALVVSMTHSVLAQATTSSSGATLIQTYCYECHGEGMRRGGIDLEDMLLSENRSGRPREWEKAWKIVRHEFMPPVNADKPTPEERKAMTDWILTSIFNVDFEKPDPGRVTIRRLNRMEYEYSVTDLFGYDFATEHNYSSDGGGAVLRLRDHLPPDDTAFGFDNIGDFQTVSPALLEKYFTLAEFVVSRVVQTAPQAPERELTRELKVERSTASRSTTHTVAFEAPHAGEYRLDVQFSLGGWQEFGGAYAFQLRIDDRLLSEDLIEVGGEKWYRYTNSVSLPAGRHAIVFTTDPRKADFRGNTNHLDLRSDVSVRMTGPLQPDFAEYREPHRRVFFRGEPPSNAGERTAYAREILERIATRAFRRPVDSETLQGLTDLAMRNPEFNQGIAQALTAILTSPRFFFRAETQPQPDDPKVVHPLDEFALASRLSYLLWLSIPDEELLQLARENKLRANLRAQVKRMLADARSARFFEDFPGQWLRTRNVLMTAISRDEALRPVRSAMKRETEMLFEHIARNDRDLIELITADYTFANRALATFYGIEGVEGSRFQKVALKPESKRGGILTHGSFLVSTSNPNRTSPVKRGLFVLENLLSIEPPPPPPDIPPLDDAKVDGVTPKTVREQLAAHRENKSCAACHAHFDPFGIVLENYDLMGRWRDKESGQTIEASETTVTGETLAGIDDLRAYFAVRKDKFYRGATEKLMTYALGRGLEPFDAVTVDRIASAVAADGGKFSTMLFGVIESPAFQMRRGDDGSVKDSPRFAVPPIPPPEKRRPTRRRFNQEIPAVAPAQAPEQAAATNP